MLFKHDEAHPNHRILIPHRLARTPVEVCNNHVKRPPDAAGGGQSTVNHEPHRDDVRFRFVLCNCLDDGLHAAPGLSSDRMRAGLGGGSRADVVIECEHRIAWDRNSHKAGHPLPVPPPSR
jgi:hypothetical protein